MSDKGGLQLLPESRKKLEIKIPGENRLVQIGGILITLVLILGIGGKFYNHSLTNKVTDLDNQIKDIEAKRDKKGEQNLLIINRQISLLNKVFAEHIFWSKGLGILANSLENNVQFKNFSASTNESKINFRAATNSYSSIAKQIASFVSIDSIKDLSLDNISTLTDGSIEFSVTLNFDSGKFLKQPKTDEANH